jgi:hypothetical protein
MSIVKKMYLIPNDGDFPEKRLPNLATIWKNTGKVIVYVFSPKLAIPVGMRMITCEAS